MDYLVEITVSNAEGRIEEISKGNLSDEDFLLLAHCLNLLFEGSLLAKNEINFHERVLKGTKLKNLLKKCPPRMNTKWYITVLKRISSVNTVRLKIQPSQRDSDNKAS